MSMTQSSKNLVTDGQTDESDFIGRFPTNVKRPIRTSRVINSDILRIKNTEFSEYLR